MGHRHTGAVMIHHSNSSSHVTNSSSNSSPNSTQMPNVPPRRRANSVQPNHRPAIEFVPRRSLIAPVSVSLCPERYYQNLTHVPPLRGNPEICTLMILNMLSCVSSKYLPYRSCFVIIR